MGDGKRLTREEVDQHLMCLDAVIDPHQRRRAEAYQTAAWKYESVDRVPRIVGWSFLPGNCPVVDWPTFPYSEAFRDRDKMLINQLATAWMGTRIGDDRMFGIRPNYGMGIIPSVLGCRSLVVGDEMPWIEPISMEEALQIAASDGVDLRQDLAGRTLETAAYWRDRLSLFPNLSRWVKIYVCDTEGPFDLAFSVLGARLYTDVYDHPCEVHRLLDFLTYLYIEFTKAYKGVTGEPLNEGYHGPYHIEGGVRVTDDSAVNISRSMYEEFCVPYNERILAEFGGGFIHYCGKGYQLLESALNTRGVRGINFGNGEIQDLDMVTRLAAPRKICVTAEGVGPKALKKTRTGIILMLQAASLEEARILAAM